MTDTNTATVEVLTAEVRVLMVGSRQITMSVAKQLDVIPLSRLTPFGRVRLGDWPDVIGADTETGALSLSWIRHEVERRAYITLIEQPERHKPLRCSNRQPNGYASPEYEDTKVVSLAFGPDNWPITIAADDMEDRHTGRQVCPRIDCELRDKDNPAHAYHRDLEHCTDDCMHWDSRDYRGDIARQVELHRACWRADRARVAAARSLPLIVLAGLR